MKSIGTRAVVELRDRAIIAILIYTAARAGAVASLKLLGPPESVSAGNASKLDLSA